ncbi:MAG: SPFH domain-containing protein [Pseudomonadota bacterium]
MPRSLAEFMSSMDLTAVVVLLVLAISVIVIIVGLRIVPQSQVYVVERFGKFEKILHPGLNVIIPGLQYVAHKVSVLERQMPSSNISVITGDNVQVGLNISVFYRIVKAELAIYRIADVDGAVATTTAAIIRAACGELDFDDVQSKREFLNNKIKVELAEATKIWGIEITRTEVLDVIVDEAISSQMQQQMAAEREKRATVLKAEAEQEAIQRLADAELYKAEKEAHARRLRADAEAYATRTLAEAIASNGQSALDFEIMRRKVEAVETLGASGNSKVLVLPSDVTGVLGGLETLTELATRRRNADDSA